MQDRILFLLKLDARNLFQRLKSRQLEYLSIFSAKRSREHLGEIFKSRYDQVAISELKLCSLEVIRALDDFYNLVDEMKWFLYHTNEMPSAITMRTQRLIRQLEVHLVECESAIDQELTKCQHPDREVDYPTEEVSLPVFSPPQDYPLDDRSSDGESEGGPKE